MLLTPMRAASRLILPMAAVLTIAAIGVGHANPKRPPLRIASPSPYQILGRGITALHGGGTYIVDRQTGRLEKLPLPSGVDIDQASVSPWEQGGRRQVVGVGLSRSGIEETSGHAVSGLVRMSLPDGEILDRLALPDQALPGCPPCWIPGAAASILYAGGDDRLYRVDFEASDPVGKLDVAGPRLLDWQAPMPGAGGVRFKDVTWPDEPQLDGRALASLCFKDAKSGRYTKWQVWWLELDHRGGSIVAAGRFLEPTPSEELVTACLPNLVRGTDDTPLLAYLAHFPGSSGYQLRVAPIHFGSDSGFLRARDIESRTLAEGCSPARPTASPEGRWISIVRNGGPELRAERVAIPDGAWAVGSPQLAEASTSVTQRARRVARPDDGS